LEEPLNYFKILSTLVALSLFLSACGGAAAPSGGLAKSDRHRVVAPYAPASDLQTLVDGNNAFALDLYQSLRDQDGNLFYSPFSISLALAMTYAGARGSTESQMANTLHFDLSQDQLHPAFNALDQELAKRGEAQSKDEQPLQLDIANAVWAEQSYTFLQAYLDTIAENYGAGIRLADFINQAESTRKEINNWVSDQTNDKINDLIPPGALGAMTRMVLVNAIYFKADWADQFEKDSTSDKSFHLLDGSAVNVPMMHQGMQIPYNSGDGYQAIELAYQGETAAMDILVPDEDNFQAFESSLEIARLNDILAGMQPTSVDLTLPKFNFTDEFNLSDTLKSMGMADAFNPNTADFTGMSAKRDLYITDVVHKAFVAVDEKGTEAAAATGIIVGTTSIPLYEVQLRIDRPFIFVIRDLPSGQILFVGRVMNPAQ
jgi:serpin B